MPGLFFFDLRRGGRALLLVVLLALGLSACSSGGGVDEREFGEGKADQPKASEVTFTGAGRVRLTGTFTMPVTDKAQVPGVLFVSDISTTDRNGVSGVKRPDPLYADLSRAFTEAGMATFRYDRRGVGQSKLPSDQQRVEYDDLVGDAKAAFSFLAQRKETQSAPLAVVGFESGGLIALRVAAGEPLVKGLVLVSTPGRPLVDVLADAFAKTAGPDSAAAFRQEVSPLLSGGTLPGRDAIRPEHQAVLPADQDALLRTVFALDPLAEARSVQAPTLVVAGTRSTTVTPADAEGLAAALPSAEVATTDTVANLSDQGADLPGGNLTGGGPQQGQTLRSQPALSRITAFLTARLGGKG